jgi:hypothetical protein
VRVAAAAAGIALLSLGCAIAGVGAFEAYPEVAVTFGPAEALAAAGLVALSVAPFAGPSARLGVARA